MTYRWSLKDFIHTRTQSAVGHTHHTPDLKYVIFTISRNTLVVVIPKGWAGMTVTFYLPSASIKH